MKVYAEPGRFGGWPANHGLWAWSNEILVGFSRGFYKDLGERHNIDRERPEEHLLARSEPKLCQRASLKVTRPGGHSRQRRRRRGFLDAQERSEERTGRRQHQQAQ